MNNFLKKAFIWILQSLFILSLGFVAGVYFAQSNNVTIAITHKGY